MSDVGILTDSNSGITPGLAKKLGVGVVPMPFLVNGSTYFEGIDLNQDQFYRYLEQEADVSTSQPSPASLVEIWESALERYKEVVYIPMSSGLSASCATAAAMAQEYGGRVQVVDNKRISVPQYQAILDALEMAREGMGAADIRRELERTAADFSVYITVDSLKYLKKGGRITGTAAVLGTMLNIKPVLKLGAGKLEIETKCRGMKMARHAMIEALKKDLEEGALARYRQQGKLRLMTAYTNVPEEVLCAWNQEVMEAFGVDYVESAPLTLSIACHTGPGVLGIGASCVLR